MKFVFYLTIFALLTATAHSVAIAQEVIPSSSDEAQVQQNLKDRIQKVVEEKRDQVKGIISDGQTKRGFVGIVRRVSEEALNLETPNGTVILSLTEDVTLLEGTRSIEISDVEIENEMIVMGYQDGDEFEPRRLVLSKTPLKPAPRTVAVGNVQEITRTSVTLLERGKTDPTVYSLNTQTEYTDMSNEEIALADIEEGQDILIISVAEDANSQSLNNSVGRAIRVHSLAQN